MRQRIGRTIGVLLALAFFSWLAGLPHGAVEPPRDHPGPPRFSAAAPPPHEAAPPQAQAEGPRSAGASDDSTEAVVANADPARPEAPRSDPRSTRPTERTGGRPTPAELDDAPPATVRAVLQAALAEARQRRPLALAATIIDEAAAAGEVRVIFEIDREADPAGWAGTLDSGGRAHSVEDLRLFPLLGSGAALLSPGALLNLITETATRTIELDALHAPSLLSSVPQIGADVAHQAEEDGDGFAVAVIDTGVDGDHPMFASRLIEEACFSVTGDCPNDASVMLGAGAAAPCTLAQCDHGTHVAGIAVGDAAPNPLVGVAPHAELIAINVFSDVGGEAAAYTSDILAAMQHVLVLATFHDVAAVNLSLGGDAYASEAACDQASPSLVQAAHQLRNARIATVAAAGNDGFTNAVSSPACLSNVIAVGSVSDSDGVSSFSNSADFLTLLAPGETIVSAAVGGGTRSASGTSMATPHVSGAIAAIREAQPDATVSELENALLLSGEPILDPRNGVTKPRLQVDQTLETLGAAAAGGGGGGSSSSTNGGSGGSSGGGGGGGCGLIGIEPFLVLPLIRIGPLATARRRRARA
ncbi:MAG: S8 family serine peptidase [Myxococcota bacterium]